MESAIFQNCLHAPQGVRIFLNCLRLLPRQRFTPLMGLGGRWNSWFLVHGFSDQCDLGEHRVKRYFSFASTTYQTLSGAVRVYVFVTQSPRYRPHRSRLLADARRQTQRSAD